MKDKLNNSKYYNWDISSGDYVRSYDTTLRYEKKIRMKKRFKEIAKIFIAMGIFVTILSFFAFYFF